MGSSTETQVRWPWPAALFAALALLAACLAVAAVAAPAHARPVPGAWPASSVPVVPPFTITPSAGEHGSISPPTPQSVFPGGSVTFSIVAAAGYHIADVLVDGASVGPVASYTFSDVQAAHTIAASFAADATRTFAITPSAGANGSISPPVVQHVSPGGSVGFSIAAASGYRIDDVLVDGVSVGALSRYVFTDVQADHTISARFVADGVVHYTLTPSAGDGGSITPPTPRSVAAGGSAIFTLAPFPGRHIADVEVDGQSVGAPKTYAFLNVRADHTISARFEADPVLAVTAPAGGTLYQKSSAPVTYTLSTPVSTGSFRLWLKNTATNAWVRITPSVTSIAAASGETTYTVPWTVGQAAGTYRLWVYYYAPDGTTLLAAGQGAGTLTIAVPPVPVLKSPNSGTFSQGAAQTVSWTMPGSGVSDGSFRVWLKNAVTNAWVRVTPAASPIPAEPGATTYAVPWTVTQAPAAYKLWVYYYAPDGTTVLGSAQSSGTITVAFKPRLVAPQSGSFSQGTTQTVSWSVYTPVSSGSFRLWLKDNATGAWTRITPSATPIPAEAGRTSYSASWAVTQPAAAYTLWVYYYSDAAGTVAVGSDTSTGTITLTADPKPSLTSPQSGTFAQSAEETITWTMTNGGATTGSFHLWLKNTATGAWVRITPAATPVLVVPLQTSYSYAWKVTQPVGAYKLWVYHYAANGTTVLGTSQSTGTVTLTAP